MMDTVHASVSVNKEDTVNEILDILRAHRHEDRQWIISMLDNFARTDIEKECKETEEKLNYLKELLHKKLN